MSDVEDTSDELESVNEPILVSLEQAAAIEQIIDQIRPNIQNDGGDIELVSIEGGIVRVALTGACTHCGMAGQTLGGIRRRLVAATGLPLRVLPAVD